MDGVWLAWGVSEGAPVWDGVGVGAEGVDGTGTFVSSGVGEGMISGVITGGGGGITGPGGGDGGGGFTAGGVCGAGGRTTGGGDSGGGTTAAGAGTAAAVVGLGPGVEGRNTGIRPTETCRSEAGDADGVTGGVGDGDFTGDGLTDTGGSPGNANNGNDGVTHRVRGRLPWNVNSGNVKADTSRPAAPDRAANFNVKADGRRRCVPGQRRFPTALISLVKQLVNGPQSSSITYAPL